MCALPYELHNISPPDTESHRSNISDHQYCRMLTLEEEEVETEPGQCGTLREGEGTDSDSGEEFTTEAEKMEGETSCKERRDPTDFGSCYVAFTINNRLLVLSVSHRYR